MGATAKFVRDGWGIYFNQHNTRWYLAQPDKATALLVEKEANRQMKAGVDLRPADKRPASTATATTTAPAAKGKAKGTLFETFANRWLAGEWTTNKESTNRGYEKDLRVWLYPALKGTTVEEMDRKLVNKVLKGMIGKVSTRTGRKLRSMSIEGIHATLSVVLEAAVEAELIPSNPAFRIKAKYLRDPDQVDEEVQAWSPAECARFLATVKTHEPHWYAFFYFSLRCGTRVGETAELRWEKDFKHPGKVHVQRAWAFKPRRALKVLPDDTIEFIKIPRAEQDRVTNTKGKKRRLVDLFPDVEQMLKEHRAAQKKWAFARGKTAPVLTFTSEKGMHIADVTALKVLDRLIPIAKVPRITTHGLRHTYASIHLARGESLDYVSRQLGHAQISTTENTYRHFIPDDEAMIEQRRKRQADIWGIAAGESGDR